MNRNGLLRKLALKIHLLYDWAYTLWKVRETNVTFRESLTAQERKFYLELWPILALKQGPLVVYDIGASVGIMSGCLAKISNITSVHAFEPIPASFQRLTERMRPYSHVTCHNVALGNVNQQMKMWVMDKAMDSSSLLRMGILPQAEFSLAPECHEESVPVVRLDDYVREQQLPPPDLVKIDVQGFEDQVLWGGRETIGGADYCLLEMSFRPLYEGSPVFDDIYREMRGLGFRLISIAGILKGKSGMPLQVDAIFENELVTQA